MGENHLTFFVDRSIGGRHTVGPALGEQEGVEVVLHDDVFPDRAPADQEWLAWAGEHGCWVLTRDVRIGTES